MITTKQKEKNLNQESDHPQCHIHDKVEVYEIPLIRKNLCNHSEIIKHTDGNHYCIFHLPNTEKADMFEEAFMARLRGIEKSLAVIKKLPKSEQKDRKAQIPYDFSYVYFPSLVDLQSYNFESPAYFFRATFTSDAKFHLASFFDKTSFSEADFNSKVYFVGVNFLSSADFRWTNFNDSTYFKLAKFRDTVSFKGATFTKVTVFDEIEFDNNVSFNSVVFGEESEVLFRQDSFAENVDFQYCTAKGYLQFINLSQKQESEFDFQEAKFGKAKEVSFHTVRLHPSWFVNIDLQKTTFISVQWENIKPTQENIRTEIKKLLNHKISEPYRVLEITCRTLAQTMKENLSYEEASDFFQMADLIKQLRLKDTFLTKTESPTPLSFKISHFIFNKQSYMKLKAFLSISIISIFRVLLAIFVFSALQNIDFANNSQVRSGLNVLFIIYFIGEIFEFLLKANLLNSASRFLKNL